MTIKERTIHSLTSRCKVVVWHYVNQTTPQVVGPESVPVGGSNTGTGAGATDSSSGQNMSEMAPSTGDIDVVEYINSEDQRLEAESKERYAQAQEAITPDLVEGLIDYMDESQGEATPTEKAKASGAYKEGGVTPGQGGDYEVKEIVFDSESSDCPVVEVHYNKAINQPAGDFQMTLVNTDNIHKMISPGDWIAIYLTQGGMAQQGDPQEQTDSVSGDDVPKPRVVASSAGRSSRNSTVESMGDDVGNSTVGFSEPGEETTYYWTDAQYEQFLKDTEPGRSNNVDSSNILSYADTFNQKVLDGSWVEDLSSIIPAMPSKQNKGVVWSLRCFGNVSRVERKEVTNRTDGSRRVTYGVYGLDFGKVFVKSIVYLNQYLTESAMLGVSFFTDTLQSDTYFAKPDEAVKAFLELIIGSNSSADKMTGLAAGSQRVSQWMLPDAVSKCFGGASGVRFNDILQKATIQAQPDAFKVISAFLTETTNLWQLLISHANTQLNELFPEMTGPPGDEKPALFLRYYPYALRSYQCVYKDISKHVNFFMDLPKVAIDYSHIFSSSIGYSDHERCNVFYLGCTQETNRMDPMPLLMAPFGFPKTFENSVERYGTFPAIDSTTYGLSPGSNGEPLDIDLLAEWNNLRAHWLSNQHQLLNGSMEIIGNPYIRVGKRLIVNNQNSDWPYDLSFYILGYLDSWRYPGLWTQTLTLHRGVYIKDDKESYFYEVDNENDLHIGTNNIKGLKR